jgi:hypothetical protein
MAEKIVTLISDRGAEVLYKRYGARIPLFLAEYPPKEGYRVVIEMTDLLSMQKGRMALLREAINAGKKPCDVGLPGIENDVNTLVCTARLLDPQERVIRSACASMKIEEHKDLEALETAANQRLLAALNFGGEVLDEDEDRDLAAQHLTRTAPPQTGHTFASSTPDTFEQTTSGDVALDTTEHEDENDTKISAAERRMIENLARRVNQPMPTLRTRADVKNARQALNALARQQRNGASPEAH